MKEKKDEELMALLKHGDKAAFNTLFERYKGPIFNFMFRMLKYDREAAEDLFQEVFMKVFRSGNRYEPRAGFSTWLYTIARNECLNHLKSRVYQVSKLTFSLDEETDIPNEAPSETDFAPGVDDAAGQAVNELPDSYREIFILHAVEGLSHEETARVLDMNPATVRTHYHRGRKILKDKLSSVLADRGEE